MAAEIVEWIEPNGDIHTLTWTPTGQVSLKTGASGLFMPGFQHSEDIVPFQPGSRRRNTIVAPRSVDLPLFLEAADEVQLRILLRQVQKWFNPLRGDGTLRVTAPDGKKFELKCRLQEQMQIRQSDEVSGINWQDIVITLRGFDPYWYDVEATAAPFSTGTDTPFFPFFPMQFAVNYISVPGVEVENNGDVEVWPVWIIEGPGDNIALTNEDTGDVLDFGSFAMLAGEILIVDTRPTNQSETGKTAKTVTNFNAYPYITPGSVMWPLDVGVNHIRMDMSNTTALSKVTLTYKQGYFGP